MLSRPSVYSFIGAALLACAACPAWADSSSGFYVGAGIGQARYGIDLGRQVADAYAATPFAVSAAGMDGSDDAAYRAFAGYQFSPYFALEAGWRNLGSIDGRYTLHSEVLEQTMLRHDRWKLSGFDVSLVGQYPLADRFAVLAKVGAFRSKLGYREVATDDGGSSMHIASDENDTRLIWGVGGSYRFTDHLIARLDWDRIQKIGATFALDEQGNGKFNHVNVWSANLIWRF